MTGRRRAASTAIACDTRRRHRHVRAEHISRAAPESRMLRRLRLLLAHRRHGKATDASRATNAADATDAMNATNIIDATNVTEGTRSAAPG